MIVGYITIGTDDLPRAKAFWDELIGGVGGKILFPVGERGYFYTLGSDGAGLMLTKPYDTSKAAHCGNGPMVALKCDSRKEVRDFHAKALSLGAKDEGAPGLRGPEGPQAFYGAYFRDLDGSKFCIYNVGPDV
ncbi:hypothetical protein HDU93_004310 [Gonapodya sp. JEL0774]|nr:hypothetical protein HDU93_004310 [Gonapodya sp. JEL0774]